MGNAKSSVEAWSKEEDIPVDLLPLIVDAVKARNSEDGRSSSLQKKKGDGVDPGFSEDMILSCLPASLSLRVRSFLFRDFLHQSPFDEFQDGTSHQLFVHSTRCFLSPGARLPLSHGSRGDADPLTPGLYLVRHGSLLAREIGRETLVLPQGTVLDVSVHHPELCVVTLPDGSMSASKLLDSIRLSLRCSSDSPCVVSVVAAGAFERVIGSDPVASARVTLRRESLAELAQERAKKRRQAEVEEEVLEAVRVGNVSKLRELLSLRSPSGKPTISLTHWGTPHTSPVFTAIKAEQVDVLRAVCDAGASLNVVDSQGWSPLHHACSIGWVEGFHIVLSHVGSDAAAALAMKTHNGDTAVHLVAAGGSVSLAQEVGRMVAKSRLSTDLLSAVNSAGATPLDLCSTLTLRRALRPKGDQGGASHVR